MSAPAERGPDARGWKQVRRYVWIACATGLGFGVLTVAVWLAGPQVPLGDLGWHSWVLSTRTATDVAVANVLTWGGSTWLALPVLLAVGMWAPAAPRSALRRLRSGIVLSGLAGLGVFLGLVVNHRVDRLRAPVLDWAGAAGGPSYPSGHTTTATVFALCCAWALTPRARRQGPRAVRILWVVAVAYAAVVGWTRVWLGVHWASDVVGGWLYGTAWVAVMAAVLSASGAGRGPESR